MTLFAALVLCVSAALFSVHVRQLHTARALVSRLQAERAAQQVRIDSIEGQAQALQRQNAQSERSIERIERTLGAKRIHTGSMPQVHALHSTHQSRETALAARLSALSRVSAATRRQTGRLAGLAKRVLNLRRLAGIARARFIAAIPSLNPVNGGINAAFGWRTNPFPEFHKGLDLAADYGTVVRAAAAGTVASAAWDGGFGLKIDLDHGNGYHTWYCHLSHVGVVPGRQVAKGQPIGAVGSTGESTGPHLHYQIMRAGVAVDPMPFLHGVPQNVLATLPRPPSVQ